VSNIVKECFPFLKYFIALTLNAFFTYCLFISIYIFGINKNSNKFVKSSKTLNTKTDYCHKDRIYFIVFDNQEFLCLTSVSFFRPCRSHKELRMQFPLMFKSESVDVTRSELDSNKRIDFVPKTSIIWVEIISFKPYIH